MADIDRDSFWDIQKLVPKAKKIRKVGFDTSCVDISDDAQQNTSDPSDAHNDGAQTRLTAARPSVSEQRSELVCEYSPDNAFIKKVSVFSQSGGYKYYEDFERAMHKYLRLTVKEAERVPFFSYVPQYSQLSSGRLAWYLYWRSGCRRREYMPTDFSYVLLYVFELLNFAEPRHPERIAEELCSLWKAYRGEFWQLDKYMPDWVCDYCLVHRVKLPYGLISDFVFDVLGNSSLREFYLGEEAADAVGCARALVLSTSSYNYRKSKFYTPEYRELFDTHIPSAAEQALGMSAQKIQDGEQESAFSFVKRDVYVGALCTSTAKRTLLIEYRHITRQGALRTEASLAVKYAENKLRAVLGIKSRLSTTGISEQTKKKTDEYFAQVFGERQKTEKAQRSAEPDYMAYYDSPVKGLEYERAAKIELSSWETAALMAESFDGEEECGGCGEQEHREQQYFFEDSAEKEPQTQIEQAEQGTNTQMFTFTDVSAAGLSFSAADAVGGEEGGEADEYTALFESLDADAADTLALIVQKQQQEAQRRLTAKGVFLSSVCERINSAALDILADILIECEDGEYYVLPDYESEVIKWLKI